MIEREILVSAFEAAFQPVFDPAFRVGAVQRSSMAEAMRVRGLIEQDMADREAEQRRLEAIVSIGEGHSANTLHLIVPPTPQWFGHGDFIRVRPKQDDVISRKEAWTVRRRTATICFTMNRRGVISDELYAACAWYRDLYEQTGLDGRMASVNFAKEVHTAPQDRGMPFSEEQIDAQEQYREARETIPAAYRLFFEKIVIEDVPLRRACRYGRE